MPEHLRLGVAAESIVFGALVVARTAGARPPRRRPAARRVDGWRTSRIDPIRQYVRLLASLVLFAENELAPDAA